MVERDFIRPITDSMIAIMLRDLNAVHFKNKDEENRVENELRAKLQLIIVKKPVSKVIDHVSGEKELVRETFSPKITYETFKKLDGQLKRKEMEIEQNATSIPYYVKPVEEPNKEEPVFTEVDREEIEREQQEILKKWDGLGEDIVPSVQDELEDDLYEEEDTSGENVFAEFFKEETNVTTSSKLEDQIDEDLPSDYNTLIELINSEGYSNPTVLEEKLNEAVDLALEDSNLCLQIDSKGVTYLNPQGVVSRKEALESFLAEDFRDNSDEFYSLKEQSLGLFEKESSLVGVEPIDYATYNYSPTNFLGLLFGNLRYSINHRSMNLPITRLELASILYALGYINIGSGNTSISYKDTLNKAIYSKDGLTFHEEISNKEPESWIAKVMDNRSFLFLKDYVIVSSMIKTADIDEEEIRVLGRVSRLEFMFIFKAFTEI